MKELDAGGPARLCIVTAVDIEFKTATGLLVDSSFSNDAGMKICRGCLGNRQITVLQSKMGAVGFAQQLGKHLEDHRYDALIVAGLAGALDPQLKLGDAVVFDHCLQGQSIVIGSNFKEKQLAREENESIVCDSEISKYIFEKIRESGLFCLYGSGVTALRNRYRALAIDMETYHILTVCKWYNLPATALRVISDEAHFDLPDFNRALNRDGQLSHWRTAAIMIRSPLISARFLLNIRPVIIALRANLFAVLNA
jgi:nucleoside phosphorylase